MVDERVYVFEDAWNWSRKTSTSAVNPIVEEAVTAASRQIDGRLEDRRKPNHHQYCFPHHWSDAVVGVAILCPMLPLLLSLLLHHHHCALARPP